MALVLPPGLTYSEGIGARNGGRLRHPGASRTSRLLPVARLAVPQYPRTALRPVPLRGRRTIMHTMSQDMENCIQECLSCHRVCLHEAMNHCLELGGKHTEPSHFRLMLNCAEICQTSADFMLSSSQLYKRLCAVCAEVCEACARSCEQLGDMDECVKACRRCAESCKRMAA